MADDSDRTGMVQVDLTQEAWEQRAEKLAEEETAYNALLEKKRSHNREWNEQLRQAEERITVLAEEVSSHKAWMPAQAEMFGGGDDEPDPEPEAEAEPEEKPRRRGRRAAANVNGYGDVA